MIRVDDALEGVTFVSEDVRVRCGRALDLISAAARRGNPGTLRLDGFNRDEEETKKPRYVVGHRPIGIVAPFMVTERLRCPGRSGTSVVVARYRSLESALRHFPGAEVTDGAREAAERLNVRFP